MKINEVAKKTNLTKKAIRFYEQKGLITPSIDYENGYRDYNINDMKKLFQITLFRQLDLSIKDIQALYENPHSLNKLLEDHKSRLETEINRMERNKNILNLILENKYENTEEITANLKLLSYKINLDDIQKSGYIKKELLRMFPGTYGKILLLCFSPFLNIKIDTKKKEIAWFEIIKYLDSIDINYPEGFEKMFEKMPGNFLNENGEKISTEMNKFINMSSEDKKDYEIKVHKSYEKLLNNDALRSSYIQSSKIYKTFRESLLRNGFYNVFVSNFMILSKEYKEYHDFLIEIENRIRLSTKIIN